MEWKEIKKKIIAWFGNIQVFPYPMFIMFGHTAYKIKGEDTRKIFDILQPGDILFRRYNHYLSGLMIPGYFTHAAIYIGKNKIIHAIGDGVIEEDILTFCRCDDIAIIRCKDKTMVEEAITFTKNQLGKEYDFDFNTECPDKFYCTELVYHAFNKPSIQKARPEVMPDEIFRLPDSNVLFEHIYQNII